MLRRAEALAPVFLDRRHDQPPLGALACELAAQLGAYAPPPPMMTP